MIIFTEHCSSLQTFCSFLLCNSLHRSYRLPYVMKKSSPNRHPARTAPALFGIYVSLMDGVSDGTAESTLGWCLSQFAINTDTIRNLSSVKATSVAPHYGTEEEKKKCAPVPEHRLNLC